MTWNLVVLFLNIIMPICGTPLARVDIVHLSKAMVVAGSSDTGYLAEVYETIPDVSLQHCVDNCKRRQACAAVNYHIKGHLCYFIGQDIQSHFQLDETAGYVSGRKAEWNMDMYQDCLACSPTETCIQHESSTNCITTGCGPPDVPNNATSLSNMYNVASKVLFRFGDQCLPVTDASITCLSSGQWEQSNFSCIPETSSTSSTTTTTTIPTPTTFPPFVCHTFDNVYRGVSLSDNTNLKYKVVTWNRKDKDSASSSCRTDGGELIEILTPARLQFVQTLTNCPGFNHGSFWIDGTYKTRPKLWKTTTGTIIPMTSYYWVSGKPDDLDSQHCIRLEDSQNYKFDNMGCSNKRSYMCEIKLD